MHACMLSCLIHVQLFAVLWTIACQAPLSMGFPSQEYWSGLPFPFPGDFPDPGFEPASLTSLALASGFFTCRATWEALRMRVNVKVRPGIFRVGCIFASRILDTLLVFRTFWHNLNLPVLPQLSSVQSLSLV